MKKNIFFLKSFILFSIISFFSNYLVFGQDNSFKITDLKIQTRVDFNNKCYLDTIQNQGGFSGRHLNFILNGDISSKFKYAYRQRLNVPMVAPASFFKATDWAYLTYLLNDNISISAGKQIIYVGGYDYDAAPIDIYYTSYFCANILSAYEMGASISLHDANKQNQLIFQFANSPFVETHFQNMYSYNLIWYGNFEYFKPIYSVNMMEYEKGKYINYIALGNKFVFDKLSFYFDYMNRASFAQDAETFFSNFSLLGELAYNFDDKINLFLKGGYDANKSQPNLLPQEKYYDKLVIPGSEYYYCGLGLEYFPLKGRKDIRLHTNILYNKLIDKNEILQFNIGLTWRFNVLKALENLNK